MVIAFEVIGVGEVESTLSIFGEGKIQESILQLTQH